MGPKQRLGRRTRGDIEKWNQTGSREIPDRGEDSRNPRPPFAVENKVLSRSECHYTEKLPKTGKINLLLLEQDNTM